MSASVAAKNEASLPTARDVPLGPLAGMDVPLWKAATGAVLHLSADCRVFRVPPQRAGVSLRVPNRGSMADVPEPGGCQSCPNPFPDYYTEARHLVSRMEELGKLADRLKAGHDLDAYCGVLTFRMHGPGGRDRKTPTASCASRSRPWQQPGTKWRRATPMPTAAGRPRNSFC